MELINLVDVHFLVGLTIILGVFCFFYFSASRKQAEAMKKLDIFLKQSEQLSLQLNSLLNEQRRSNRLLTEIAGYEHPLNSFESEMPAEIEPALLQSNQSMTFVTVSDTEASNQNKLYVGNIDYSATESELERHFSHFGQIEFVNIPVNRYTGRARGFGFVTFVARQDAERAMTLNGSEFKGRQIQVNFAKERESA